MTEITKETVTEIHHGHTPVGTSPVNVIPVDIQAYKGILLRCPSESDGVGLGNTVPVYIGGSGVTADQSATGGIALLPGQSITIPIEHPSLAIYAIASALRTIDGDPAGQDLSWMLV